jgi:hypothetical protein
MNYHPMPIYTLKHGPPADHEQEKTRLVGKYFRRSVHWHEIRDMGLEGIRAHIEEHGPLNDSRPLVPGVDLDDVRAVAEVIWRFATYKTRGVRSGTWPQLICVCHIRLVKGEGDDDWTVVPHDECKKKALADGYEFRRDLTPTR